MKSVLSQPPKLIRLNKVEDRGVEYQERGVEHLERVGVLGRRLIIIKGGVEDRKGSGVFMEHKI